MNELLCIGNALIDVFARDEGFRLSSRFGIKQHTQHVEIEVLIRLIKELPDLTAVSGGGAANVAKIAGFLGLKTGFTGSLGHDDFGQLFEKSLAEAGVKLNIKKSPSPTGICLVLENGKGKTRIAASPSASLELSETDISEDQIKKASIVLIDGFMLSRPGIVPYVMELAARNGITAAIDLSSPDIAGDYVSDILNYARNELIIFMNDEEAGAFYNGVKAQGLDAGNDIFSFFQSFTKDKPFPIIVVKLGEMGAITISKGQIHSAETQAIIPKDKTGAGDAFCAAFLAAWLEKKSLDECTALGNRTACIILDATGTQVQREFLKNLLL